MLDFPSAPKAAACYVRVSTDDQADRGTIESQIEYAHKYCDLNNIAITQIYKDDGITGTIPLQERPAGFELLQDAQNKLFDTLLVFKLDRLGRATRVILNAIYDLEQFGVKLKSMTEPFDTGDASGRFLLTILAGVADLERSNILDRMWLGANRAAAAGKWLGGIVPYGYFKNDDGYLEINDTEIPGTSISEADVVRLIYKMLTENHSSCNEIANHLNALGIPPAYVLHGIGGKRQNKTRGIWLMGRIYNMARSTTYMGIHQYGKRANRQREITERQVPAIVSNEVWATAQKTLHNNQLYAARNTKHLYLLRSLIKCGNCGLNYRGAVSKGAAYYTCGGRSHATELGRKRCLSRSINMQWLDNAVWEDCLRYINDPSLALQAIENNRPRIDAEENERTLMQQQLTDCDKERERILDLYRTKLISMNDITNQLDKIAKKKLTLQKQMHNLQAKTSAAELFAAQDSARELLEILRKKISSQELSIELKQNIIRTLIEQITATTEGEGRFSEVKIQICYKFHSNSFFSKSTTVISHTDKDSLHI